jgi:hypothetical protein
MDEDAGREKGERGIALGPAEVGRVLGKEWWRRERPRAGCGSVGCATYHIPKEELEWASPVGERDMSKTWEPEEKDDATDWPHGVSTNPPYQTTKGTVRCAVW